MSNDLCDYSYSQMANSGVGGSLVVGAAFFIGSWLRGGAGIVGLATAGAAYEGANTAAERGSTAYLRGCRGKASLGHYNCMRDKCHV